MSYDFTQISKMPLSEANKFVIILRCRDFDRYARDFLSRQPEAVVVNIGCGLDSRYEWVHNGWGGREISNFKQIVVRTLPDSYLLRLTGWVVLLSELNSSALSL